MPSEMYELFERAINGRKQITCMYKGARRELCPHMLGHKRGDEVALTFQFAGKNEKGLPTKGWKCLQLSDVRDVKLRDGAWYGGSGHSKQQTCLDDVDMDVNPKSPYRPRRPIKRDPQEPHSRRGASRTKPPRK
jgi:hypothetical protein